MSEPKEAVYEAAIHLLSRRADIIDADAWCVPDDLLRELLAVVEPIAVAEGRRQIAAVLRDHFLAEMVCDHERERDNPRCACSRVHLGWYPTVVKAAEGWIAHVLAQGADDA